MNIIYLNCGKFELDRKKIIAVIDTTFAVVKRKPEKNQASTGFEPVTSAICVNHDGMIRFFYYLLLLLLKTRNCIPNVLYSLNLNHQNSYQEVSFEHVFNFEKTSIQDRGKTSITSRCYTEII